MLTPTKGTENEPFVRFGQLRVQRELVAAWTEAQRYLCQSSQGRNALFGLENGKAEVTVRQANAGQDLWVPGDNAIEWDPKSAWVATNGGIQTPAMGLLHEEGHAYEFTNHFDRYARQRCQPNRHFEQAEEQRNYAWEGAAARELGEPPRHDCGGQAVEVEGPLSKRTVAPMLTGYEALAKAINDERFQLARIAYTFPPPAGGPEAIRPWDHQSHQGPIVILDGNTAAQYVTDSHGGDGHYQIYDVRNDLKGVFPPENAEHAFIDAHGHVAGHSNEPAHATGIER